MNKPRNQLLFSLGMLLMLLTGAAWAQNTFYELKATSIDKKQVDFSQYQGKVVLVVNIASQCGFTPQLAGLQKLYEKHRSEGLVVLGFPSNDFRQEPLDNVKIGDFCKKNFGVDFPIFTKQAVKGNKKQPVFKFLVGQSSSRKEVSWNFEKFLVDKKGSVVGHYGSDMRPEDPKFESTIKALISRKV